MSPIVVEEQLLYARFSAVKGYLSPEDIRHNEGIIYLTAFLAAQLVKHISLAPHLFPIPLLLSENTVARNCPGR